MTPASSAGSGRGDRAAAVDSRGRGKGMTGRPGEAAARHVAAGDARVPGAGGGAGTRAGPWPAAAGLPGKGRR